MSDDDYDHDYDYSGLFDSEDEAPEGLAEHVDSLAEHTSHSPVLVNAHPDYDIEWDEWEYLTDEYYDAEHENAAARKEDTLDVAQTNQGKRKRGFEDHNVMPEKHKRRKTSSGKERVTLHQPLVVWRERSKRDGRNIPLLQASDGKQVSLLENWRDFMPKDDEVPRHESDSQRTKRRSSHKTLSTSGQTDKRKAGEKRLDHYKEAEIQQTEHPPITFDSGPDTNQ